MLTNFSVKSQRESNGEPNRVEPDVPKIVATRNGTNHLLDTLATVEWQMNVNVNVNVNVNLVCEHLNEAGVMCARCECLVLVVTVCVLGVL